MLKNLRRCAHALVAFLRVASGVLLVASVAINFFNIIGRYFFATSIPWAEELMLFLMVGCVFLGAGVVGWSDKHIRMDAVVALLPPALRDGLEVFTGVVLIATSVVVAIFAWPVVEMLAEFDQRSQAANFPLVIPQAMVPIGLLLMAFLIAVRMLAGSAAAGAAPTPSHER
jgi:TRAP-type C4-dicarboxylate transport system permease small subunit